MTILSQGDSLTTIKYENDVLLLSMVQFTQQKKQMSAGTHADRRYILYYSPIISAGLSIGSDRPRLTGATPWRVPKKYVIAKLKMNLYIYESYIFSIECEK